MARSNIISYGGMPAATFSKAGQIA